MNRDNFKRSMVVAHLEAILSNRKELTIVEHLEAILRSKGKKDKDGNLLTPRNWSDDYFLKVLEEHEDALNEEFPKSWEEDYTELNND